MKSFARYFLEKELVVEESSLCESTQIQFVISKFIKNTAKNLKDKYVSSFEQKYPNIQGKDIEEAFEEALGVIKKSKPKTESLAKKMLRKQMHQSLSDCRGKKDVKKNLSCIGVIKSSFGSGVDDKRPVIELMKKANGTLTAKEKKVMELCTQGKSVRTIGLEMNMSFPTAWRVLNSAIDKVRIFHGMRSRHKDIRSTRKN